MNNETPAICPTDKAHVAASLLWPDRPGAAKPTAPGEVMAGRAAERLRELGVDLMHAARRAACIPAADDIAWPARCRQALQAVELCRRAAELAARR